MDIREFRPQIAFNNQGVSLLQRGDYVNAVAAFSMALKECGKVSVTVNEQDPPPQTTYWDIDRWMAAMPSTNPTNKNLQHASYNASSTSTSTSSGSGNSTAALLHRAIAIPYSALQQRT